MLLGQYETKITAGYRLAIPKKFRAHLGEKLVVTQGYEGCLILVGEDGFKALAQEALNKPFFSPDVRQTTRFLLAGATEIMLDKQGRFVVPVNLQEYGGLREKVVFIGLINWVEIWDEARWSKSERLIRQNSGQFAKRLLKLVEPEE